MSFPPSSNGIYQNPSFSSRIENTLLPLNLEATSSLICRDFVMFTFNGFVQVSWVQTQAEGSILLLSNRKTVYPIRGLVHLGNDTFFSIAIQSFLPFNMKAKRNSNGKVHRWSSILLYLNIILLGHTCKALKHILVLARHHLLRIHSFCQAVNFLFKTKHCACFKSKNRNRCYIYNQTVFFPSWCS